MIISTTLICICRWHYSTQITVTHHIIVLTATYWHLKWSIKWWHCINPKWPMLCCTQNLIYLKINNKVMMLKCSYVICTIFSAKCSDPGLLLIEFILFDQPPRTISIPLSWQLSQFVNIMWASDSPFTPNWKNKGSFATKTNF